MKKQKYCVFPGNSGKRVKTFRDPGIWKKIFRDPGNFEKIFRDPGVWNVTGTGNLCKFFPGIGIFLLFLPGSGNFLKIFPGSVNLKYIGHRSLASSNRSTQEKWWKHSVFISYNPSLHPYIVRSIIIRSSSHSPRALPFPNCLYPLQVIWIYFLIIDHLWKDFYKWLLNIIDMEGKSFNFNIYCFR